MPDRTQNPPTFMSLMFEMQSICSRAENLQCFIAEHHNWYLTEMRLGKRINCPETMEELKQEHQFASHEQQNLILNCPDDFAEQLDDHAKLSFCVPGGAGAEFKPSIIFAHEQFCGGDAELRIASDGHGNFSDFSLLIINFLRDVYAGKNVNLIFLGDYVDRGGCSLETLLLVMLLQRYYPERVILLRGNHETYSQCLTGAKVSQYNSLLDELRSEYGKHSVGRILQLFCDYFGVLPLSLINAKWNVFMAHAGPPMEGEIGGKKYILQEPKDFFLQHNIVRYLWGTCVYCDEKNNNEPDVVRMFNDVDLSCFSCFSKDLKILRGHEAAKTLEGAKMRSESGVFTVTTSGNLISQMAADCFRFWCVDSYIARITKSNEIIFVKNCQDEKDLVAMRTAEFVVNNLDSICNVEIGSGVLTFELTLRADLSILQDVVDKKLCQVEEVGCYINIAGLPVYLLDQYKKSGMISAPVGQVENDVKEGSMSEEDANLPLTSCVM
ncbi:MAG: metallophosphoesterase [Gammaproteobacteria bacterium]|nr:metallophosphoesterase [Gammaproteobacteria bacterium]